MPDTSWAHADAGAATDDSRTRARMVTTVQQRASSDSTIPPPPPPASSAPDEPLQLPEGPRRRWPAYVASAVVALVVLAVVIIGALNSPDVPEPTPTTTAAVTDDVPSGDDEAYPPAPLDLAGERVSDDVVRFTWTAPTWDGDLVYVWRLRGEEGTEQVVGETSLELTDPGTVCVEVASRSEQGRVSFEYADACAG